MIETTTKTAPIYDILLHENMQLRHELELLKKVVFGSRHEKFVPSLPPEQLSLDIAIEVKEQPPIAHEHIEYTRQRVESSTKPYSGTMPLPALTQRKGHYRARRRCNRL